MKVGSVIISAILVWLPGAVPSLATGVELQGVNLPDRHSLSVRLVPAAGLGDASANATISYRDGRADIEVSYASMRPAVLFGGQVTSYVLWAVTREGVAESLGELQVVEAKGEQRFETQKQSFALVVTAEAYRGVRRPSSFVLLTSAPAKRPEAEWFTFSYDGFGPAPEHEVDDLAGVPRDSRLRVELIQARRTHDWARGLGAAEHATALFEEADALLARAEGSSWNRQAREEVHRVLALDNEAIQLSIRRKEALDLERRIAERQAEMESLHQQAAEAKEQAAQAQRDVERLRADAVALEHEKQKIESDMTEMRSELFGMEMDVQKLHREKQDLGDRLQEALSHVAETRQSVRGFVVNLPDILFAVDEAQLTPDAKIVVAKLTGILLVMPDLKVVIEGHTDASGSAAYNLKLSRRRAESVQRFMVEQGVAEDRLRAFGFGLERPVADNDSPEGRRKNRRVEIVILESEEPSP